MAEDDKKEGSAKKTATSKKSTSTKKTATSKKDAAEKTVKTAAKKAEAKKTTKKTSSKAAATKTVSAKKEEPKNTTTKKAAEKKVSKKETPVQTKKRATKKETLSKKPAEAKKSVSLNIRSTKTTFFKPTEFVRKWLILDAAGKPLGRVAALAASMLRGKHKVYFAPNADCGDSIIIINCEKAVLTGKKLEQKVRYHHSGWMGGIKETKYSELMKKEPERAMSLAVIGMLPHNSLGAKMAKHLRTYRDENHGQEAQKPEIFEFKV